MSKKKLPHPTEAELSILNVLWMNGPSSVREVNEIMNKRRPVGYTTTLKLMQIMVEKQLAIRNTTSRTHIYEAVVEESATKNRLIDQFVNSAFKGSAMKLVMQALGNHAPSQQELDEIKALISKIEKSKP